MINILLVEDNPNDIELLTKAFQDLEEERDIATILRAVKDGDEAIQLLNDSEFKPQLILLDLNLPGKSGLDVLKELKQDTLLRVIPVVILTNSRSEDDVIRAYSNYCNAYIRKPIDYERIIDVLQQIGKFWFDTAVLVPERSHKPGI